MQHVIFKPILERHQFYFIRPLTLFALLFSFLVLLSREVSVIGFPIETEVNIIFFIKNFIMTLAFFLLIGISFPFLCLVIERLGSFQHVFTLLKDNPNQALFALLLSIILYSCDGQPLAGVNKDLNTGMVTTYSKIKPAETVIVMNEEKLGHTQIPLGEKFIVVNTNVKGLVVKDNKISIGCSLIITDLDGKELLREEDLFKDNSGIYDEKEAENLRCTVSTGKPMEYDKKYNVAVRFWDKYGTGSIENKLAIEIIDLP